MCLKLFFASLLACGFMNYVIANENTLTDLDKNIESDTISKISNDIELLEIVPEVVTENVVKNASKTEKPKAKKKSTTTTEKTTKQPKSIVFVPVTQNTNKTNALMQRSGALRMSDEYLGELGFDIMNDNGYNWGK